MAINLKFIVCILLAAGLGLCWYPLSLLRSMQLESSQLLFFAFSTASLLTITSMARQVEKWRNNTLDLLIFALTGGISNVLVHYSLLHGNPIVVISLLSISMVTAIFLVRLAKGQNLVAGEFITILSLLLMAIFSLVAISGGVNFHWSQALAVLAGVGFYRLFRLNEQAENQIPLVSKLSALFIVSTWLVGMVLIFSPQSTSFPQEYAVIYSALYGTVILVPVLASVVHVFTENNFMVSLSWITALLGVNLIGLFIHQNIESISGLLWPLLLLIIASIIQVVQCRALSSAKKNPRE